MNHSDLRPSDEAFLTEDDSSVVFMLNVDKPRDLNDELEALRVIADDMPQLAWMTENDGRTIWCNKRWLYYTGVSSEHLRASGWRSVLDPGTLPQFTEIWDAGLAKGRPFETSMRVRIQGDMFSLFRACITPLFDPRGAVTRWYASATEITDLAPAEALRESEAAKNAILQSALDAIVTIDHEGIIAEFNPAAESIFGYTKAEVMGQPMAELIIPVNMRDRHQQGMAHYLATGDGPALNRRIEVPALRADGTEFPAELAILPIPGIQPPKFTAFLRDISLRKEAEEALNASEQRFRTAVGIVSSLIWTNNTEGMMEGEQPGWSNFTGQTRAEYEGYGWSKAVHPADAQPTINEWRKAVAGRRLFEFEHRVRRHDGIWRLCEVRALPLLDDDGNIREWLGVHTDITERRRIEKNAFFLASISQDLASMMGVDELMATMGAKIGAHFELSLCVFVEINDAAGEVTVTHDWHRDDVPGAVGVYVLKDYFTEDFQLQGRAGKPFVVNDVATDPRTTLDSFAAMKIHSFVCVPLIQDGKWRFELCIHHSEPHEWQADEIELARELTARIWTRFERLRIEAALAERVAELAQADQNKDEFLAMLAHELRNPLASVSNAVLLLKTSSDKESHEWGLRVMERQTRQLATLIEDLLDVSRITTGKIRLRKEVLDITAILDRACETVRAQVEARRHELIAKYERGKMWVNADPTRLEQVVVNLLTNAVKYTPEGGTIQLASTTKADQIAISVSDNGIGIVPEKLPEIFELFTQGERAIDRSEGGLGIGLTIVEKLVEMHGGTIGANSEGAGRGSTFTVTLDAVEALKTDSARPVPSSDASSRQGLRILVVDDNVDSAQGLQRLLARAGHQITLAFDGYQALSRAKEISPDAIILDIGLPGMDGYEVAKRLRNEFCCSSSLFIALTGYGQEADRQRAYSAGFNHHLVKPVDIKELKRLLTTVTS